MMMGKSLSSCCHSLSIYGRTRKNTPPVVLESGPGRPELLPVDPESKERLPRQSGDSSSV
jgi:hypothetical protein